MPCRNRKGMRADADTHVCPSPPCTTDECCHYTGLCSGNTDSTTDYTCPSNYELKVNSNLIECVGGVGGVCNDLLCCDVAPGYYIDAANTLQTCTQITGATSVTCTDSTNSIAVECDIANYFEIDSSTNSCVCENNFTLTDIEGVETCVINPGYYINPSYSQDDLSNPRTFTMYTCYKCG